MITEMITVKLDKKFLNDIDSVVEKNNYQNRTEFIRNTLRNKLIDLNREKLIDEFLKFKGKSKKKLVIMIIE